MILGMNHFTAIAKDPVATLDFYEWPISDPPAGVIDHMAFTARDLKTVKATFDSMGYPYKLQHRHQGPWQLFCLDPSGAKVELNSSPNESLD